MKSQKKNVYLSGVVMLLSLVAGCGGGNENDNTNRIPQSLASVAVSAPDYGPIVQQLYISYFGRPADPDGLESFKTQLAALGGPTNIQQLDQAYHSDTRIRALVDSFGVSAESNALYSGDNITFITAIYHNVLNRAPDSAGLAFWANALNSGALTRANASLSIMAAGLVNTSVQGRLDAALINNKVTVGSNFTDALVRAPVNGYDGNVAAETARAMLSSLTDSTDIQAFQSTIATVVSAIGNLKTGAPVTISGTANKGPINRGAVTVYTVNGDGSKGAVLGNGMTLGDNTGNFSVTLSGPYTGPLLIEVQGGSYTSEYDGKTVVSTSSISSMLSSVPATGAVGISVSPLSDMAAARARVLAASGGGIENAVQSADKFIRIQYGLKNSPSKIIPKFDAASLSTDPQGAQLAFVLSALDTLGHRLAPADPDAIIAALSADISDGVFNGMASNQLLTLAGKAMPANAGATEFLKSVAVTNSAATSGLRAAYVDAHFKAGTLVEEYQAKVVPVYVDKTLTNYKSTINRLIPNTTLSDTSAAGTCDTGAPVTFDAAGVPTCGAYYKCPAPEILLANSRCSGGSIAMFYAAQVTAFHAAAVVPYSASNIAINTAASTVGVPDNGTLPIYTATVAHVFTEAERAAMLANDRAAGDAAAAKMSGLGALNQAQVDAFRMINNAIFVSSGLYTYVY